MNEDLKNLLEHWNNAFRLGDEDRNGEYSWEDLAPSQKLIDAVQSFRDCENVLDYGSGSGWAGIAMAKGGCRKVTCADVVPNAKDYAGFFIGKFGVQEQVKPVCVDTSWLSRVPDGTYDGFFCSNVLDVVPPDVADEILGNSARVLAKGGRAVIGLNFHMDPKLIAERGFDCRNGNQIFISGVLRLVNRTDEQWSELFGRHFIVESLEYFAGPGEERETRRLVRLKSRK